MPDDKSHIGEPGRSRVAGDQDYEVRYLFYSSYMSGQVLNLNGGEMVGS